MELLCRLHLLKSPFMASRTVIELHADFFDAMGFREGLPGMMQTHPLQLEDSINVLRFMVGFCPQLSLESGTERICRRGAPAWHDAPRSGAKLELEAQTELHDARIVRPIQYQKPTASRVGP